MTPYVSLLMKLSEPLGGSIHKTQPPEPVETGSLSA